MPTRPPCATIWPRFSAWSSGAEICTCTSGLAESTSCTLSPAARMISPLGEVMMPLLSTFGAIRNTCPPPGVVIVPWLLTLPAPALPTKLFLPARKSASLMFRLDATRPLTSTRDPAPNMTPFGLIKNTLPFDCSAPRIWLGSWPVMRLSTLLSLFCWMKRVMSLAPIEKLCQLKLAGPATTCGALGLACAALMKQAATTAASTLRCKGWVGFKVPGTRFGAIFFMVFNLFNWFQPARAIGPSLNRPGSGGCAGGYRWCRRCRRHAAHGHNRAAHSHSCPSPRAG